MLSHFSKAGGSFEIKKHSLCLFLSVAIVFWEVWDSVFFTYVNDSGEDLGYQAFGCQIDPFTTISATRSFNSFKKKGLEQTFSLDSACLSWLVGGDLEWMEAA